MSAPFRAVVLAGERPGGSPLARELGVPANVLAPLAGRPCLAWVFDALRGAQAVSGGVLCGPQHTVLEGSPDLAALLAPGDFRWVAPALGPAASASAGADACGGHPLLLTTGDHGLLQAPMVDAFCADAQAASAAAGGLDVVVGLVPHEGVVEAFPESRRTVLRFADGAYCGSNLFALLGPASRRALAFWTTVEAQRKRPWKIARHLGVGALARYLSGRMPVDEVFERLSKRAGCRVGWVAVNEVRAAVDVDSLEDWALADRLRTEDGARGDVPTAQGGGAG